MNKEFKRFISLPIQTQYDVCTVLLFSKMGSECNYEFDLMLLWLEDVNPLIYVLAVNGVFENIELFGDAHKQLDEKVADYLLEKKLIHYERRRRSILH